MIVYIGGYDTGEQEIIHGYFAIEEVAVEWLKLKREQVLTILKTNKIAIDRVGEVERAAPEQHPHNWHFSVGEDEAYIVRPVELITEPTTEILLS